MLFYGTTEQISKRKDLDRTKSNPTKCSKIRQWLILTARSKAKVILKRCSLFQAQWLILTARSNPKAILKRCSLFQAQWLTSEMRLMYNKSHVVSASKLTRFIDNQNFCFSSFLMHFYRIRKRRLCS
jgi:hypothetical protein